MSIEEALPSFVRLAESLTILSNGISVLLAVFIALLIVGAIVGLLR